MLHFGMNMPFYLMSVYGSIMIAVVLILRALFRNRLPKFVFPTLWALVLLRFLIPFSVSIPLSMPVPANPYGAGGNEAVTSAVLQEAIAPPQEMYGMTREGTAQSQTTRIVQYTDSSTVIEEMPETTLTYGIGQRRSFPLFYRRYIVPIVYLLGLLVTAGILVWQKYRYMRRLRDGLLIEHNDTVNAILRGMDMGQVLVFTSDGIATPLACGLLNPRIYLPTQMDFQNTVLLRHVLVHEAMHIRRKDNWLKGILLIVLVLNWYNPLVWLMAVCLPSDLEAACDAAVLAACGAEERKDYASSLLAMALAGRRTALLYSAFSRTEVEKRVKNVLRYKKTGVFVLLITVLFLSGSMIAFAAVGQAPFSEDLTSFCASDSSRWGVKVTLSRDIVLGENAQDRAEGLIFSILVMDATNDPRVIEDRIRVLLAEEFGVEKGAFHVAVQLCLGREELEEEYARWGLTRGKDGFWMYQEEQIRIYEDKMLGSYQSREKGSVDILVQRDEMGEITAVGVWRQGDPEYDVRTRKIEETRWYSYGMGTAEKFSYATVPSKDGDAAGGADGRTDRIENDRAYEYYLTKDELFADIDQGYIFKMDTALTSKVDTQSVKYAAPYVSQDNWPFYVHEENTVNLEIAFSNLLTKPNRNIFPGEERIIVDVISPEGESVYRFEKTKDEIKEDTSIQEQISVTSGEWTLQISFAYVCGETPSHLKIAVSYEAPSEEDIRWLKEERVR